MVTQVTLGSFFTLANGKTVLGGTGGSGLDTQGLIKSLTEAKQVPVKKDQDLIDLNNKQSSALSTFQSLLSNFKSSADALRNPPGVGNAADNVFKFTTGSVSAAGSNYVSITTSAGAALQDYEIKDISSVATAARQTSGTFAVASADADVVPSGGATTFAAGTITFAGQDIAIASGDSLNVIAAKFNAVSTTTGVTATVIAVDSTHYKLSFVAKDTGDSHNFDLSAATDPDGVLTNIGLVAPTAGTNAAFKLNGIDIVRQSNVVNDVVNGVTFNILQTTPDAVTPYTVSVKPDTTTIQNAINNFITNYNAIKNFEATQTQLNSDGTYAKDSILVNNQTFLSIMNNVNSEINTQVAGITGSNPKSLVDIGITFTNQPATDDAPEVDNILTVNDGQLTSALSSNFDGVSKMFGFNLTSNNANLTIFSHTNSLSVTDVTFNIDPGTSTYTATYNPGGGDVTVDLTATPLSGGVDGYTLKGPSGSALEGLQLIYASTSAATITAKFTQGIADRLFNTADSALKQNTGAIAIEQTGLKDRTARLTTDIDNLNQQIDFFQQQLISKFSALEQAIARVNNLLSSMAANDQQRFIAAQ